MYKSSIYLVDTYFPTYLPRCMYLFLTKLVTKVKPNINLADIQKYLSSFVSMASKYFLRKKNHSIKHFNKYNESIIISYGL